MLQLTHRGVYVRLFVIATVPIHAANVQSRSKRAKCCGGAGRVVVSEILTP
jgi:hypothetical protein